MHMKNLMQKKEKDQQNETRGSVTLQITFLIALKRGGADSDYGINHYDNSLSWLSKTRLFCPTLAKGSK